MKIKTFNTLLIFLFLLLINCNKISRNNQTEPNIILINVDDLGWKDLTFMGSKYYQTPYIDKLAESGIIFYNAYASAANCAPSRASMLSGKYPTDHKIYTVGTSERGNRKTRKLIPEKNYETLDLNYFTIPEMLKKKGYINGHFGKWHLGPKGFYPEQSGFDINIGGNEHGGPGGYFSPYVNPNIKDGPDGEYLTDRIGDEVVNFIEKNKNNKFFAYVPFYAVHTPIESKNEYENKYLNIKGDEKHNRADYAGMIQSVDENVGKILNKISQLNLFEETLIIFTSDNGGVRYISNQFPLRSGKGSYYEGGIRVPLIFSWKNHIKSNSKSFDRVSNIDFFPTIKKIVGYQENIDLEGLDLSPIFENRGIDDRSLFFHFPIYLQPYNVYKDQGKDPLFRTRPGSVIIKGDWKLHHYFEDDKVELYNLINDPSELDDLSQINHEIKDELYNDLLNWREQTNAPVPSKLNPDYDQAYVDSLNHLIYNKKARGRLNNNEK